MVWNGPTNRATVVPADGSQQKKVDTAIDTLQTVIEEQDEEDILFLWTGGKEANCIAKMLLYDVGDVDEQSPVPWGIIDTGNHFDGMCAFREEYLRPTGDRGVETVGPATGVDDVTVRQYDELFEGVVQNEEDPRGYHGRWDATVDLPAEDPIEGLPRDPDSWDVPSSCGAVKTVPLRQFVEEDGHDVVITGRRAADPIVAGTDRGEAGFGVREERKRPTSHVRINPLADWEEANVYAYLKAESVSLPSLYTEEGYRHTDSECCTGEDARAGEYGEGGRDPRKVAARQDLEDMGYI